MRDISNGQPLRAIAFSGYCGDDDVRRSIAAGFSEHLAKPIDFRKLRAAVERVLTVPPPARAMPNAGAYSRPN